MSTMQLSVVGVLSSAVLAVACGSDEGRPMAHNLDHPCTETVLLQEGDMNPVRTFQFDTSGRVIGSLVVADNGMVVGDQSLVYDAEGFVIEEIARTRVDASENADWHAVVTAYTYSDEHASYVAVVTEAGVADRTWTVDLNAAGDPVREYFPETGDTFFYVYNEAGMLMESRQESDQGFAASAVAYIYDGDRLIREDHTIAGALNQVVDYLYSDGALELRITDPGTPGSRKYKTFEYDEHDRQISETFWQGDDVWDYRRAWGYACWDAS